MKLNKLEACIKRELSKPDPDTLENIRASCRIHSEPKSHSHPREANPKEALPYGLKWGIFVIVSLMLYGLGPIFAYPSIFLLTKIVNPLIAGAVSCAIPFLLIIILVSVLFQENPLTKTALTICISLFMIIWVAAFFLVSYKLTLFYPLLNLFGVQNLEGFI